MNEPGTKIHDPVGAEAEFLADNALLIAVPDGLQHQLITDQTNPTLEPMPLTLASSQVRVF